jgi:hypothetical protein
VQQVVQQGGHRWVVIRVVLRAEVLDGEYGVGGDTRPLRHLRARTSAQLQMNMREGATMMSSQNCLHVVAGTDELRA